MNRQKIRSGWNTKGGTWRDDLEYAKDKAIINDPDSRYWLKKAEDMCIKLHALMGEAYGAWAEHTWPGDIKQYTAKRIYEDAHAEYEKQIAKCDRHWSDDPKYWAEKE